MDGVLNDRLCLVRDAAKMVAPLEALRVKLVDILGARGTRREPAARSDHFQSTDGRVVPWRRREPRCDDEQSIRILPSQSTVINAKVESTTALTTVIGKR